MKTRDYIFIIVIASIGALLYSCSTTKRIPPDEYLYTGIKKLDIQNDSVKFPTGVKDALYEAVDYRTNKKKLGLFSFGLWIYNNWSDSATGWKKKLYDKWVEEPILVSDVRPQLRTKMLDQILDNNGYFRGTSSYELVHPKNKPKKAKILYTIDPGPAFGIDSLILLPDTTLLNHYIDSLARKDRYLSKIPGIRFSMDSLSVARTRITNSLRNRGYYYFSPEFIEYLADTLMYPGKVVMKMDLASNIPLMVTQQYITGDVTVYAYRYRGGGTPDTIELKKATLIQMQPSKLRRSVFEDNIMFTKGRIFSVRQMNNTQSYLSRLGIFQAINIEAIRDTTAKVPTLNVRIGTTFDAPWEASIEANVTSKSNSYLGPGLNFGVTNKNIFGGGEQLNLRLTGSYEWQTGRSRKSIFNSYEIGLQSTLAFPRMLAPSFIPRRRRQINWTRINLNFDLLNRPHYFKIAQFNTGISYEWQSSRRVNNSFTPFKLTYTKLLNTTETFDSMMVANPAVALSFRNQFIPQMSYSVNYDYKINNANNLNFQATATEAGNLFWSIYEICGVKGTKKLLGTPFSQFIKGQAQVVWDRRANGNCWIVSRLAIGAAHAYGNSSQVPYTEQFYCGGANSVRAFPVRSIGPGSYHDPKVYNNYFDQTGTFKFEANVEYRFPIWAELNGAIFLDAGNVWLLKSDPLRPGGKLQAKTFWRELATGTGVGLRYDIGMLVLRGDLGIAIHAPYDTGKSGYYNITKFKNGLCFHLAIGYPF